MVKMTDVESTLLEILANKLDDPRTFETISKKYNELIIKRQGGLPRELELVEQELNRSTQAVQNFTNFISQGNLSETIVNALKVEEKKLEGLKATHEALKRQVKDRVYITPNVIKTRLQTLHSILAKKIAEANQVMRRVFPEKITMTPSAEGQKRCYRISGVLNLYSLVKFDSVEVGVPNFQLPELGMLSFEAEVQKSKSLVNSNPSI